MSGYDPKPRDPRRLTAIGEHVDAHWEEGHVRVTLTVAYEPWCCHGAHEVSDAVDTVLTALDHGAECQAAWVTPVTCDKCHLPDTCPQCGGTR